MPIRINLLAEQQAAEEARRRDPVKRAVWAGSSLVLLMALWIVLLQVKYASAKAEFTRYSSQLQALEDNSKEARFNAATANQLENRIANLHRYATNRFFSAPLLDALQQLVLDDIRIVQLQSTHVYSTNAESVFKTNLVFALPQKSGWAFWKAAPPQPNIPMLVSNQLATITNKVESLRTAVELVTKIDIVTNGPQATAHIEIVKPTTSAEHVWLTIKARDYADPPGKRVNEFSRAIAAHPYFAQRLLSGEGEGIRLRDRVIQPEFDAADPVSPTKAFVPFVIECRYRETLRANE